MQFIFLTKIYPSKHLFSRYCLSAVEPDYSFTLSVNVERPLSPRRPVFRDINKNDEEINSIRYIHIVNLVYYMNWTFF